ncbi:hypothetical protein CXQ85_003735 [Candidozyma haemuli]|uniref:Uncharacterized protein n=1 Tax=Candidozyma haemuli TaxID=45357 RepID=A0A2V1B005_9ASCO|nr:hypothetical protein CXQ85_003735 [[Candida] haemuloni]PVH23445.1 hypothetical protein CXQ85_003735 [[Candida] haemuloni]
MKYNHFDSYEFQRKSKFRVDNSLKALLKEDGEPIAEDAFEYTHVPHRLARAVNELPTTNAYTYCESKLIKDEYISGESIRIGLTEEDKILQDLSERDALAYINILPDSDAHFTMNVFNENNLSNERMTSIIRDTAWVFVASRKKRLQKATDKLNILLEKQYLHRIHSESGDESSALTTSELSQLLKCEKTIAWQKKLLISAVLIGNSRIIAGKAHFPGTKSPELLRQIELQLVPPVYTEGELLVKCGQISINDIYKTINFMNTSIPPVRDTDSDAEFSFSVNETTRENFLWAKVLYKPTPRAQSHFENNFLHPSDQVYRWSRGEMIENTWEQADVLVLLGSEMVPPKRAMVDRIKRNLEHSLKHNPRNRKLSAIISFRYA